MTEVGHERPAFQGGGGKEFIHEYNALSTPLCNSSHAHHPFLNYCSILPICMLPTESV